VIVKAKCGCYIDDNCQCDLAPQRPILFSAPMVRAILAGKKSQTRRLMRLGGEYDGGGQYLTRDDEWVDIWRMCPYGVPGDLLWVKETFLPWDASGGVEKYIYRATEDLPAYSGSWKPSLFMPRKASRITLKITGVRAERLQEISSGDILAEGVDLSQPPHDTDRLAFARLWNSINAERGYGWDKNPWVWVINFKRIEL
jgi:hypothetical protein